MPNIDTAPNHNDPVNAPSTEGRWSQRAEELLGIFDDEAFPDHSGAFRSTTPQKKNEHEMKTLHETMRPLNRPASPWVVGSVVHEDAPGPLPAHTLLDTVMSACAKAKAAKALLDTAKSELAAQLENAMALLMAEGTIVQRHRGGDAFWLHRMKTMRGNDRGTNTFEIAGKPVVHVNMSNPELSTWSVEAIPISEKTGRPMSGATHGSKARHNAVSLSGDMSIDLHTEDGKEIQDFFTRLIVAAQEKAPKSPSEEGPSSPVPSVPGWIEP
jgi:hypothetical protein